MNQDISLLSDSPNTMRSFERTTPFSATSGCYRSRIYTSDININPLIAACDQILSLAAVLKTTEYPEDSDRFLQDLAHEIRSFEHRAQVANYQPNTIIAARFALCSLLDEIIISTEWGQKNNWSKKNLLSLFHNENYGGARFFSIIDRSLENIFPNLHLIELLYLCLNFGFTGKYLNSDHGQNELTAITNKLYQIIGQYSHINRKNILIQESKSELQQNYETPVTTQATAIKPGKLFCTAISFAVIVSGLIYLGISLKLNDISKTVYSTIPQTFKNKSEIQS